MEHVYERFSYDSDRVGGTGGISSEPDKQVALMWEGLPYLGAACARRMFLASKLGFARNRRWATGVARMVIQVSYAAFEAALKGAPTKTLGCATNAKSRHTSQSKSNNKVLKRCGAGAGRSRGRMASTLKAAKKTTAKASRLKQDRDASAILTDLDEAIGQHPMDLGAAFRYVKQLMGKAMGGSVVYPVRDVNGVLVSSEVGIAEVQAEPLRALGVREPARTATTRANDAFVRDYSKQPCNRNYLGNKVPKPLQKLPWSAVKKLLKQLNRRFTIREVNEALATCNMKSSAGEDELSYAMLDLMSDASVGHLCHIFNACLEKGKVPGEWCSSIIKLLYKKDINTDPLGTTDPKNYRGISLSSCVGKLLEAAMAARLEKHIEAVAPLSNCQNGFRKHRDAASHAFVVQELLNIRGCNSIQLFWDVKRAFPSVRPSSLLATLHKDKGVCGPMWHLVNAFYEKITSRVAVGDTLSEGYTVANGTKEGSRLSPLLYICFVDLLLHEMEAKGLGYSLDTCGGWGMYCGMLGYCDDLCGLPRDVKDAQLMLDVAGGFMEEHMCWFGHDKTVCMVVRPDPDLPSYPGRFSLTQKGMKDKAGNIQMGVRVVTEYEYLGLLFHDSGSFAKHIEENVGPQFAKDCGVWQAQLHLMTFSLQVPGYSLLVHWSCHMFRTVVLDRGSLSGILLEW
jgi:hypothetical protein